MAEEKKTKTTKTPSDKAKTVKATVKKQEPKLTKEQEKILGKNDSKVAFAIAKNVRISPRKVRMVIDLIRGKNVKEALAILMFTRRGASKPIADVLKSAIANAVNNNSLREDKLFVSTCYVTEGFTLKRMFPRARGSADTIRKRSSHIRVEVKERD